MIGSTQKTFDGFLDITDPAEFLGFPLSAFSINVVYPLKSEDRVKLPTIQAAMSPQKCYPLLSHAVAQGKTGFVPIATRWVIERSNAWIERCKSLTKNFERMLVNAKAHMEFYSVRLMIKRLASNS